MCAAVVVRRRLRNDWHMCPITAVNAPTVTAAAHPLQPPASAPSLPPLQHRTPEQLRDGLVIRVNGAGSGDIAVARLIQDAAQFVAGAAGTTMGLKDVDINDKSIDRAGALGMATFNGTNGWFGLSERSTRGIMDGIARLRTTPFEAWSAAERAAFLQSNAAILHEAGHVTLPKYDAAAISAWRSANRDFEEGLTEIATMHHLGPFMRSEFGIEVDDLSMRLQQSVSAYTRFTERIQRMIEMGTDGSPVAVAAAAARLADGVSADQRLQGLALLVSQRLGGPSPPPAIVDEIASTLPGFVQEKNGTRTKLMELQAALIDHAAGRTLDVPAIIEHARRHDNAPAQPAEGWS